MNALSTQTKTLLDLMTSKYTPFLAAATGRQSKLSFAKPSSAGGGDSASEDDDDDDDDDDDGTQWSQ